MRIVIDLSDKTYYRIKSDNGHGYCSLRDEDMREVVTAICNSKEQKTGEWKTNLTTGDIFCSRCKGVRRDTRINHINFCNSCGADMKGEEE